MRMPFILAFALIVLAGCALPARAQADDATNLRLPQAAPETNSSAASATAAWNTPIAQVTADSALVWRIYRDLHEHPELGMREKRTAEVLRRELRQLGYSHFVESKSAPTAVIAVLDTRKPGPVIALRAEMDARPTQEPESHDPRSTIDGVMHNCGHDAHAAMLVGSAAVLMRNRESLSGKIVFVWQPAEETRGGADDIVNEGILQELGVQAIFAQHVVSGTPVGTVGVSGGPTMAGSNYFTLRISGSGSHAAQPSAGSDIVLAAAALVRELAVFPARRLDILERPMVISPTSFEAGSETATNVLPSEAVIRGTIRAFEKVVASAPDDSSLESKLRDYLNGAASSLGVTYELSIREGSPPTVNDDRLFRELSGPLAATWGSGFDTTPYRGMFSEDFSFYTAVIPSLYFGLGISKDGLGDAGVHSADFTLHPSALVQGTRFLVELATTAGEVLNGK